MKVPSCRRRFSGRKAPNSVDKISTAGGSLGYARDRLFDSAPQALFDVINL